MWVDACPRVAVIRTPLPTFAFCSQEELEQLPMYLAEIDELINLSA